MTPNRTAEFEAPKPEELAAYVDGELDAGRRRAVEAWLGTHPGEALEVREFRRLDSLWHLTFPAQPSEAQWADVLAGVESAALPVRSRGPAWRTSLFPFTVAVIGAAAAILLAFSLLRWHRTPDAFPIDDSRFKIDGPDRIALVTV